MIFLMLCHPWILKINSLVNTWLWYIVFFFFTSKFILFKFTSLIAFSSSFFFYCSGFCHTLKWISHGFTCVPHPDPPSHLPLHPIPLGLPSAPSPSACLMQVMIYSFLKTPFGFDFLMLYWICVFFFLNIYGDKWDRTINFLLSLADSVCAHNFDIFSPFRINRIILRNIKVYQSFIYISFRLYF